MHSSNSWIKERPKYHQFEIISFPSKFMSTNWNTFILPFLLLLHHHHHLIFLFFFFLLFWTSIQTHPMNVEQSSRIHFYEYTWAHFLVKRAKKLRRRRRRRESFSRSKLTLATFWRYWCHSFLSILFSFFFSRLVALLVTTKFVFNNYFSIEWSRWIEQTCVIQIH